MPIQKPTTKPARAKAGLTTFVVPIGMCSVFALLDLVLWIPGPGMVITALLALTGFLLALQMQRKKKSTAASIFSGACIYAITAVAILGLTRYQINESQNRAAVLIVAMDAYHHQKGNWPGDLKELIPTHMAKIPSVSIRPGHKFQLIEEGQTIMLAWRGIRPGSRWSYDLLLGETSQQPALSHGLADALLPPWLARH